MCNKIIFTMLIISLFAVSAFAENRFASKQWGAYEHTTGGDSEALDSKANPQNGDVEFIFGTIDGFNSFSAYWFNSSSSTAESGQTNIAPDDSTAGRWIQSIPFYIFGTTGDLADVIDQAGVVKCQTD